MLLDRNLIFGARDTWRVDVRCFHIDIAEVRTAQGKLYLLVAIDRTSKFAFVEMHEKVARRTAGDFLRRLIAAVPYKVHTVLADNGTHLTTPGNTSSAAPDIKAALEAGGSFGRTPSNTPALRTTSITG